MNLHKILKIVVAVFGLLGIIFLVRIISKGDETIKAAAANGDSAIVDPMAYIAYVIIALTVGLVLIFVIKNLFTNTAALKNTLIGVGIFVGVLVVAYVLSGGDSGEYYYNDVLASKTESHLVGAGLVAFYILIFAAAGAMLFSGAKKIMNR